MPSDYRFRGLLGQFPTTWRELPAPLAALWVVVAAYGCEPAATPKREWTPADHGHPASPDPSRMPPAQAGAPEQGSQARAAAALWNVSCASCHGRGGRGDGPMPPPGAKLPDMTSPDFQSARSDTQLAEVILQGRGLMPSFKGELSESGIVALVGQIRSFAPPPNAPAPKLPADAGRPASATAQ